MRAATPHLGARSMRSESEGGRASGKGDCRTSCAVRVVPSSARAQGTPQTWGLTPAAFEGAGVSVPASNVQVGLPHGARDRPDPAGALQRRFSDFTGGPTSKTRWELSSAPLFSRKPGGRPSIREIKAGSGTCVGDVSIPELVVSHDADAVARLAEGLALEVGEGRHPADSQGATDALTDVAATEAPRELHGLAAIKSCIRQVLGRT